MIKDVLSVFLKTKFIAALCLAVFILMGLSGCVFVGFSELGSVTARGSREVYEIKVDAYNGIIIDGFCDVRYYAAPSDTVTLEVSPDVREFFRLEVINGDLVVRSTKRINFSSHNSPVLTISTPALNRLTIDGAGVFTAHDKISAGSFTFKLSGAGSCKAALDVHSLNAVISGAGKLELSGKAETADLTLSGAGDMIALPLQTQDTRIRISGAGKVSVSCARDLRIDADGMGTIEYRGSPAVSINKDGLVKIRQVN